jgi:hypothetical protein
MVDDAWPPAFEASMHLRRRTALALSGALAVAGCESFRGTTTTTEPSAVAAAAPSISPRRPSKHVFRVGPYIVHSDSKLDANDALFRELGELPEQIQNELELPPSDALVQVFLFDTADKYDEYMKARYPRLPKRRAYFFAEHRIGGSDDLLVFTWPSEHLQKDLRHELTHATLHGQGVNANHLDVLRRGPFQPDLARLEKLGQVHQMETPEYREAWAWVHLMLRGDAASRQLLLEYLQQLRTTPTPAALLPKLIETLKDPNKVLGPGRAPHEDRVPAAVGGDSALIQFEGEHPHHRREHAVAHRSSAVRDQRLLRPHRGSHRHLRLVPRPPRHPGHLEPARPARGAADA